MSHGDSPSTSLISSTLLRAVARLRQRAEEAATAAGSHKLEWSTGVVESLLAESGWSVETTECDGGGWTVMGRIGDARGSCRALAFAADAAGLVVAARAAERLRDPSQQSPGLVVATVGDPAPETVAEHLSTRAAEAVVLVEPTELEVVVDLDGYAWFDLVSEGLEAQGGDPDSGRDAIALTGPLLFELAALDRRLRGPDGLTSRVHASTIRGGRMYSAIPEECVVGVERRLSRGDSISDVVDEMDALLGQAGMSEPQFRGHVDLIAAAEPVSLDPERAVARPLTNARERLIGKAGTRCTARSALARALAGAEIPCAVFGPGREGEPASLEALARGAEVISTWLTNGG